MYYDVIIKNARLMFCDDSENRILSKVETFGKVKCLCRKEIKSIYCFVYVRKVEVGMITKWKLIMRVSDYFSNLHDLPSEKINNLLNEQFDKEVKKCQIVKRKNR